MGTTTKRRMRRIINGTRRITIKDTASLSIADLEQIIRNESLATCEIEEVDTPCNVHILSKRKRFADADGVSAKAAIDGIVHGGVLPDDSPKFVYEVSYSQEKCKKGEEEETIIELWEVDG
jgi:hypothetical protein